MDAIAKRHRENETFAAEAVEELNCHQRQDILDRKTQQYEKTRELAERLFVAMVGGPGWHGTAVSVVRSAWIQAEAMIDFANEQRPVE
jgi:methylthioribose-1-phosphate isomerase